MALRQFADMRHDEETLYEMSKGMGDHYEPPEYPYGLLIHLSSEDLEKAGASEGKPNDKMRFSAMGEVTSVFCGRDNSRIEVELCQFAGEDGKFFELTPPAPICFNSADLEKMGLDDDAELGDMIHLIGTVRLESLRSDQYADSAVLQVTELAYVEDESSESREG